MIIIQFLGDEQRCFVSGISTKNMPVNVLKTTRPQQKIFCLIIIQILFIHSFDILYFLSDMWLTKYLCKDLNVYFTTLFFYNMHTIHIKFSKYTLLACSPSQGLGLIILCSAVGNDAGDGISNREVKESGESTCS